MTKTIVKKFFRAVFLVWSAVTIAFFVLHLLPGSPIQQIMGLSYYNQGVLDELSMRYGLERPLYHQYTSFVVAFMSGDLGDSIRTGQPVWEEVRVRLNNSVGIAVPSLFLSLVTSLAISSWVLMRPAWVLGRWGWQCVLLASSAPPFIVALVVLLGAGMLLGVPVGGSETRGSDVALAILTLVVIVSAYLSRQVLVLLEEESKRAYILGMLSRGISSKVIVFRHVLRNALAPILSVTGLVAGYLIVGTVVVEVVFGIPGIGRLFYEGLVSRDYPVVQFIILSSITVFAGVNFSVDVFQIINDPRLRV